MTAAPSPVRRGSPRPLHRPADVALWIALVLAAVAVALLVRHDGSSGDGTTVRGSNVLATETRAVAPFTAVELAGANRVTVRVGHARRVVVRGDSNLVPLVTTEVRAGRLVIDQSKSFSTRAGMSVDVAAPSLSDVTLSGSGNVVVDGVDAPRFVAHLSGSGLVTASGRADAVAATLTGSGNLELLQLAGRDVRAELVGSGRIALHAERSLVASVTGTGVILYSGSPGRVDRTVSGTGAIVAQG